MATVSWSTPLAEWQTADPVLHLQDIEPGRLVRDPVTDDDMRRIFGPDPKRHSLKTWGRHAGRFGEMDPHWIGVQGPTGLHTDPAYPRFTHHLLVRADDGLGLQGKSRSPMAVLRGTFVIVDTHSPHQLTRMVRGRGTWYLAASVDADEPLDPGYVLPVLVAYGNTAPLFTPDLDDQQEGPRDG